MNLHDFGSLIWAIFILIAVVSSVFRSARRTISSAQQQQRPARPAPPQQSASHQPAQQLRQPVAQAPAARVLRPAVTSVHVPPPVQPVASAAAGARPGRLSDERLRGAMSQVRARSKAARIFGRGDALTRGVIALEVLGPPRALRDWSAGFPS